MNQAAVIADINTRIDANGIGAITGTITNDVLLNTIWFNLEQREIVGLTADTGAFAANDTILITLSKLYNNLNAVPVITMGTNDYVQKVSAGNLVDSLIYDDGNGVGIGGLTAAGYVVNITGDVQIVSGAAEFTTNSVSPYFRFDDSFTHSGYYLSNAGLNLISDVKNAYDAPQHRFTGQLLSSIVTSENVFDADNGSYLTRIDGTVKPAHGYISLYAFSQIDGYGLKFVLDSASGGNTAIMTSGYSGFAGIQYFADYSANYSLRSLVDKEYVDLAIAGATPITPGLPAVLAADGHTNNLPISSNDGFTSLQVHDGYFLATCYDSGTAVNGTFKSQSGVAIILSHDAGFTTFSEIDVSPTLIQLTSASTLIQASTSIQGDFSQSSVYSGTGNLTQISSDGQIALLYSASNTTSQNNQVFVIEGQGVGMFVTDDLNTIASQILIYSQPQGFTSDLSTDNHMIIDDQLASKGLVYMADYSANFTEESLVSKRFTDETYETKVERVTTIASSATPAINTDDCDAVDITALATAITSMTSGLSGTLTNFQKLIIRIKDNGTARAITWGAGYVNKGGTLPLTTVLGKLTTVGLIYNSTTSLLECVAVSQEV